MTAQMRRENLVEDDYFTQLLQVTEGDNKN